MAALRLLAAVLAMLALAGPAAAATATLSPSEALFGDRIEATATATVDPSAASGVRAVADFGPLDVLAGPVRTTTDGGGPTTVSFRWEVACLSEDCVPGTTPRRLVLPPVRFTGSVTDSAAWPVVTIRSRVSPADAAKASPPFRLETRLPSATYRVSPGRLELALDLVALVLVAGAVVLVVLEVRRRRRRREEARVAALSPLERALILAREAEGREPGDRRKALGLLARVLDGREAGLADTASELAWSRGKPSPGQVESLVGDVEREVGPR